MTTAVALSPPGIIQFFNNAGLPNVGGSLVCQVGGVAYPVYQDAAGSIPLPFTGVNGGVPLNSRGEISNAAGASCQLFLAEDVVYTFTLYDANGNLLNQATSVEALVPTASSIGTALASAYTAALAAEASVGAVITNEAFLPLNILRYGGDNTGTIPDNSTAFTTLINVMLALGGASVELPSGTYNLTNSVTFTTVPSGAGASAAAKGLNFYGYAVQLSPQHFLVRHQYQGQRDGHRRLETVRYLRCALLRLLRDWALQWHGRPLCGLYGQKSHSVLGEQSLHRLRRGDGTERHKFCVHLRGCGFDGTDYGARLLLRRRAAGRECRWLCVRHRRRLRAIQQPFHAHLRELWPSRHRLLRDRHEHGQFGDYDRHRNRWAGL